MGDEQPPTDETFVLCCIALGILLVVIALLPQLIH